MPESVRAAQNSRRAGQVWLQTARRPRDSHRSGPGGAILRDHYSGGSATGHFAAHPVPEAPQAEVLQTADVCLPPETTAAKGAKRRWEHPSCNTRSFARHGRRPLRVLPALLARCRAGLQTCSMRLLPQGPAPLCQHRCCRIASPSCSRARGRTVSGQLQNHCAAEHRLQPRRTRICLYTCASQTGFIPKRWDLGQLACQP